MEGPLKLTQANTIPPISRLFYCILVDELLTLCSKKAGDVVSRIHVGVYHLKQATSNNKTLSLDNGLQLITLEAETEEIYRAWVKKIKEAQLKFEQRPQNRAWMEDCHSDEEDLEQEVENISEAVEEATEALKIEKTSQIDQRLFGAWRDQALISQELKHLLGELSRLGSTDQGRQLLKTKKIASEFTRSVLACLRRLEAERSCIGSLRLRLDAVLEGIHSLVRQPLEEDLGNLSEDEESIKDPKIDYLASTVASSGQISQINNKKVVELPRLNEDLLSQKTVKKSSRRQKFTWDSQECFKFDTAPTPKAH